MNEKRIRIQSKLRMSQWILTRLICFLTMQLAHENVTCFTSSSSNSLNGSMNASATITINKMSNPPSESRSRREVFRKYKLKKKNTAEFVSLRCGIGAHWLESEKKCVPHEHNSDEQPPQGKPDSAEPTFSELPATVDVVRNMSKDSVGTRHFSWPEVTVGHIVSLYCGIGYRYDKSTRKCSKLPSST